MLKIVGIESKNNQKNWKTELRGWRLEIGD